MLFRGSRLRCWLLLLVVLLCRSLEVRVPPPHPGQRVVPVSSPRAHNVSTFFRELFGVVALPKVLGTPQKVDPLELEAVQVPLHNILTVLQLLKHEDNKLAWATPRNGP